MKKVNESQALSSHWDMNVSLKGCSPDHPDQWAKLDVTSVPHSAFLQAMEVIAKSNKESLFTVNHSNDMLNKDSSITPLHQKEADTMTISREELDAKLAQNKAEVQAIASGMREEMAAWRETQNAQMTQMNATLASMSSKMEAKFDVIDAKIDSVDKSLNGRIDGVNTAITGINTAISGIQSGISTKLTIFGVIMAVLLAIAGWWFSSNQPTTSQQTQPTVIYVQQPNASEPPQPTNNSK